MNPNIVQEQRQILSQALRQSLQYLQIPIVELTEYLQEQALSNPLLEVDTPIPPPEIPLSVPVIEDENMGQHTGWRDDPLSDALAYNTRPESFSEYLKEQVDCMPQLDKMTRSLCCVLIDCLDSTGYLSCNLRELAKELALPLYDVEQALYLLQMLEPTGVGARDVTECLLLQLAQGRNFNTVNIRMIREGLPLLARHDYTGLSRLLNVPLESIRASEAVIKALNPIPSRGFYSGDAFHQYIIPEATVICRGKQFIIEMNTRSLPQVRLSEEYASMIGHAAYAEVQDYLRERMSAAKTVIAQMNSRQSTLYRLLCAILHRQPQYFAHGEALRPMTMQQIAEDLSLNTSTVSRAVQDKYIQCNGRLIPLRSLFTASLQGSNGISVSADAARQQLRLFIQSEDSTAPLSDEALSVALSGVGIHISRRTVAKYRAELDIPSASARKKRK